MRIESTDGTVGRVVLSRRNLESLLAKLDGHPPGSACTIMAPAQYGRWYVVAEEDELHYANRDREAGDRAGRMHPDTEAVIRSRICCRTDGASAPLPCCKEEGHDGPCYFRF